MNWLFNGLPIHILVVHFVVVAIPVAVVSVGACVTVYTIGESGAKATWSSRISTAAN
jgi:hypothetical protein